MNCDDYEINKVGFVLLAVSAELRTGRKDNAASLKNYNCRSETLICTVFSAKLFL